MTPIEEPITNVIREAILNHRERENTFNEIRSELCVTRNKAKELYYAFIWYANENYLTQLLIRE